MKFAKTFCNPSAVVSAVPAGLLTKLQYNKNGILEKLQIISDNAVYDDELDESRSRDLFNKIKRFVPNSISLTGGTTWVTGVMYSDRIPCAEGIVPTALYNDYISDIIDGGHYTFYAGTVDSLAAKFQGALVIKNFLTSNKFNVLPQIVVPVKMSDETLQMMMTSGSFPFKYPFISGFFIFEDLNCRYSPADLIQITVTEDPEPFVDIDGYLKGEVVTESGMTYTFNYSTILHHGIDKGSTLLLEKNKDSAPTVMFTRLGTGADKIPETIDHDIKCPVCGKVYRAGSNDSPVQCDDPHCLSHEYYNAKKMMDTLKQPSVDYETYKDLVYNKTITCLTDLLEVPPCEGQEIKASLSESLYSVVPTSVVPNIEFFEKFANKCNNSVETVMYYVENPLRLETDLDITDPIVKRFAKWLQDPYNVSTISTILARVTVSKKSQKFDGAPIFRGNTIALTGRFKRGDYSEIESILLSYAAKVVPSIERGESLPDVVLIGSLNEGISGEMIQKANAHNIPIAYEDDFFVKYEIDKDLAENLL